MKIEHLRRWGVIKRRGDPYTVLCDFDRPGAPTLTHVWRVLGGALPRAMVRQVRYIRYDRTARGWHLIIGLGRPLTSGELVALQLALGSDLKRERYNLRRVLCGARPRDWNLLFEFKCS